MSLAGSAMDHPNRVGVTAPSGDSSNRLATTAFVANGFASYQSGTWTPTFSSSTGGPAVHTIQVGTYEKIGKQVTARFTIQSSSMGGLAGTMDITGLPFPMVEGANDNSIAQIAFIAGVTLDAGFTWMSGLGDGGTGVNLFENGSGQTSQLIPSSHFSNSTTIAGSIVYHL